jgi:hypothetical protein
VRQEVQNVDNQGISFSIRYLWFGVPVVLGSLGILRIALRGDWRYFEVACLMYVVVGLLYRQTRLVHKLRREIDEFKAASPGDETRTK